MPLAATKVQRKTLILNMSERNRETPSPWNLTNDTNELFYRKKLMERKQIVVARLERDGVGRTGIWGALHPNSGPWSG